MINYRLTYLTALLIFLYACSDHPVPGSGKTQHTPLLEPDYTGVTIPVNIAPMNFKIQEKAEKYFVEVNGTDGSSVNISSKSGTIAFPVKKWQRLLRQNQNQELTYTIYLKNNGEWQKTEPFTQKISGDPVDPYLYYRLLHPGYISWTEISIKQRNLESFREKTVVENNVLSQNCVNCHSFNRENPDNFLFHVRGSHGGTYFMEGDQLKKVNLKTEDIENGATYPRWHPSGKFVAFSSNKVVQQFHSADMKKIEVSDLNSKLVLYDIEKNEIFEIEVGNHGQFMDTYPEWSPCGTQLFFCRAAQIGEVYDYQDIRYDLYRASFDPATRTFGEPERMVDAGAMQKSISFPRVSPDGNTLVFTLHDFGCFPIWHEEADLHAIDLQNLRAFELPVNSDKTESYHSWSSNGRWLLFSSKRGDGLSARPYIAWSGPDGQTGKPFVLPQKDPEFYRKFLKTYNIPEFATTEVSFTPSKLRKAAESDALQANRKSR